MTNNTNHEGNATEVLTGEVRLSYANLFEPKSINNSPPKYSVSLIIPKSDKATLGAINAAIEAAYEEGAGKLKGNGKTAPPLAAIKTPLRDGDEERSDDDAYADSYFVNANSTTAPGIFDRTAKRIIDREEVYSGVYARADINFYAFNTNGNKGIACGLNGIQKIRDGEHLGGGGNSEKKFAANPYDDFLS